jgi:HK97 family phage major capsid protein
MSNTNNTNHETRADDIRCAYNQYLRRGIQASELNDVSMDGMGYLLPRRLESKLINAMNTLSVLRSLCTEVTTSGDSALPIVNGHGKASWVPEGHPIPMVKDAFDRVNLNSHKLAAIIRVTSELLKDSAVDIEAYLANTFADRMAVGEEEAFIAGDGMGKPLGLIHQAKVGCETQTAGTVSIEDVLNLIFSVPEKHRRNGTLLMNDNMLLSLYKQCTAQGQNLWLGKTNDGKNDTFFGYRIVRCASMPDAASGSMPILFGDFKQVYINNNGYRSIKRLDQLFIANDHIGFLMAERVGIKLMVPDAVKGLQVA